jgi:hypothetical protein
MDSSRRSAIVWWSLLLSFASSFVFAQSDPVIPAPQPEHTSGTMGEIRKAVMNANNVSFVMYNSGQICRPNTLHNIGDLVWHGTGSMGQFVPLFAAEVMSSEGNAIHVLDDGMYAPNQGAYAPDGTLKWGWLPRAGYSRSGQTSLATANNAASWPPQWAFWPASADSGFRGALDEAYYVMDDFTNMKFPYYPFPDDSSKRGLGISAEVRVYQYGGGLADAVILTYTFRNESPKLLPTCYVGFYCDPFIGGVLDYADDLVNFVGPAGPPGDSSRSGARNTIYNWDSDGVGEGGRPTAYLSFKFLKTPGDHDLTALSANAFGFPYYPVNDTLFWRFLSADTISRDQAYLKAPGDNCSVFATGPFSLAAGDSTVLSLAIFFSTGYEDMLDDANYIHYASHWPGIPGSAGSHGGDAGYAITLLSPDSVTVSGDVPVTWQYAGSDPGARLFLECSSDQGNTWRAICPDRPVSRTFLWNTAGLNDGVNYLLRVVAHNDPMSRYAYSVSARRFTVNNAGNAQPEVAFAREFAPAEVKRSPLAVSWKGEDADNAVLHTTIAYALSSSGPYTDIVSADYPVGACVYNWNLSDVPNAPSVILRITVSDGTKDSSTYSRPFALNQEIGTYPPRNFTHSAGKSTGTVSIQVVNPELMKAHTYEVSFTGPGSDQLKSLRIYDRTASKPVIEDFPMRPGISTPMFDGLKLLVTDVATDIDKARSGFHRAGLDTAVTYAWTAFTSLKQTKIPADWIIVFNSLDTAANGAYLEPGDLPLNHLGQSTVVPFRILTLDSLLPATYRILDNAPIDRRWENGEPIVLQPSGTTGNTVSYQVNIRQSGVRARKGDTLFVYTNKTITEQDTFSFVGNDNYVMGVLAFEGGPRYELFDNFPNPFNPSTTIRYGLPTRAQVTLNVYNTLGQLVSVLQRGEQDAGYHEVRFDGSNLPSGVYFYRIQSGRYVEVRKLLLLR